jgi:hypothetical protein
MNEENRLKTAAGLSSFWDGTPVRRVRVGDGAYTLYGRRVSVHLQVQPGVAARLFGDPVLADQGLLTRILTAMPEPAAGTRFFRELSSQHFRNFRNRLSQILNVPLPLVAGSRNELAPRVMKLSDEARALWIKFTDHVEREIGRGFPLESVKGLANKAAEHAARLASVRELIADLSSIEVSAESLAGGIALIQFYLREAQRIRLASAVKTDLLLAEKLNCWLLNEWKEPEDLISLPDIYRLGPSAIRDKDTARRIAFILEDHGWLEPFAGQLPVIVNDTPRREAWCIVRAGA